SSNYKNATSLTNSGTLTSPDGGYYLLASNADDLNNIFSAISESVNSSQSVVQLNETTEVRDVISPYFRIPEGVDASDVKVYTSKYLGGDNWAAAQEFPLVGENPIVFDTDVYTDEKGNVSEVDVLKVTGFDFAEHWVGPVVNNGVTTYHGEKLIVEFPVEVNPDFLGGSGVITNGAESGIYGETGSEGSIDKEVVDIYNQPSANESLKPITAPVQDRHAYIGSTIDLTSILDLHIVEGTSDKDLAEIADGVNNAYVDITYTITFQNGEVAKYHIPAGTVWTDGEWLDVNGDPSELDSVLVEGDMVFTVSCVMEDINNTENKSEISGVEGYIYAWIPVVTFMDSLKDPFVDQVNYGGENLNSAVGINWEHPKVKIYVDPAYMLGTADVTIEYTPDADCVAADGTVISRTDFYVNAVVKNNNNDINGVRFMHTDCPNTSCDVDDCSFDTTKGEFMIHVASGDLEIKKIVDFVETNNNTPEVSDFKFTVFGPSVLNGTLSYTVDAPAEGEVAERTVTVENGVFVITLKKGQTALFENLPAGSYT
ncbi:MAG: hypothetical protein IKU19_03565, partial [Clostridia bacterium]|nr:hypothetical protein [Clostridia bacterium]